LYNESKKPEVLRFVRLFLRGGSRWSKALMVPE